MGMNSHLHIAIEGMPLTGIRDFGQSEGWTIPHYARYDA
jgi:hypothetical protein